MSALDEKPSLSRWVDITVQASDDSTLRFAGGYQKSSTLASSVQGVL